jgi:HEAT repeat protein
MRRLLLLSAAALVLCAANAPAQGDQDSAAKADENKLKDAYQNTDGKGIVEFLSTRAKGEVEPKVLNKLVEDLDAKEASVRQKACQQLIAIGAPAIPKLRLAARDPDASDVQKLAKQLLKILEDDPANVTGAAVRLLAARKPQGTAEALLAYLPHSENEAVMEDIKAALAGVAYINDEKSKDNGKPDPSMLKALEDPHPLRRANAITALCAGGIAEPRAKLRALLTDKSPSVRLAAALALGRASDAKAVSTLIALLGDLGMDQGREVEAFLSELAGDQSPKVALGNDDVSKQKCRDAWAKWWLESDGPALIKELEKRTLTEEKMTQANNLIEKLGDDSFDERQKAEADLKKMGPMIMPLLRAALKNQDLEIRTRAGKLLSALEADAKTPLSPTVAKLIALRKPKGAAEAILNYVPFAEDESLLEGLQEALNAVTFTSGKANPVVVKALADKVPARRAAAASALAAGLRGDYMDDIRKRLDPKSEKDNLVRLRVALALAQARDKEAVPTLISLLEDLPADQSASAEDFLFRLARDNPPKDLPDGNDEKHKKERAAAWSKWWDDNKKVLHMPDPTTIEFRPRYLGYVLTIQANNNQIVEYDKDNKPRVTMTNLLNPWDAQWVSANRLLVAEYNGMRVTERDLKGDIKWEKKLDFYPMQAERLRNGNTFIVGQNKIVEINKAGREVLKIDRNQHDVRTARRLPNGEIVVITSRNQYERLDRNGKAKKQPVTLQNVYYYQNEILDNGNVIIPLGWNNQVIEYDQNGKQVKSFNSEQPLHVVRLPNKGYLVSSQNWPYKFLEHDKDGKKVREFVTNTYIFRIKAR